MILVGSLLGAVGVLYAWNYILREIEYENLRQHGGNRLVYSNFEGLNKNQTFDEYCRSITSRFPLVGLFTGKRNAKAFRDALTKQYPGAPQNTPQGCDVPKFPQDFPPHPRSGSD